MVESADIMVNGQAHSVPVGESLLKVLRTLQVSVPGLCYHPALKPIGSCRLCMVEISYKMQAPALRLACSSKTRPGMTVTTESGSIQSARQSALQKLLQMAPQSDTLLNMALQFQLDTGPLPDGCIRCRLCVHVCRDVVGANALIMEKKQEQYLVMPIPDRCIGCGTCANICPTHAIRLTELGDQRTIWIRNDIVGQHTLAHCEGCGKPFATSRFLDYTHHRTAPHPDVKEYHCFCPVCAKLFSRVVLKGGGT